MQNALFILFFLVLILSWVGPFVYGLVYAPLTIGELKICFTVYSIGTVVGFAGMVIAPVS